MIHKKSKRYRMMILFLLVLSLLIISLTIAYSKKSILENTGDVPIDGRLVMQVQKYENGMWSTKKTVVNETITILPHTIFPLQTIWNAHGAYNTSFDVGHFRINATVYDKSGNVIKTRSGLLEDVYEFTVKFTEAYLDIATLKKEYMVGEQINLTDPPAPSWDVPKDDARAAHNPFTSQPEIPLPQSLSYQNQGKSKSSYDYEGYIVKFKTQSLIETKETQKTGALSATMLHNQIMSEHALIKNQILAVLQKDQLVLSQEFGSLSTHQKTQSIEILGEYTLTFNGIALNITDEEAQQIGRLNQVASVQPNLIAKGYLMDAVPLIEADKVWELDKSLNTCAIASEDCLTGKGVRIAIIDTGIDYTHPDLGGCFGEGCKVVKGYDFVNQDPDPMDDNGHGTHVGGIAAGNGSLKGVAPDAEIYAYKVLNSEGFGSFNTIISALERSVDPNGDGKFDDHVDIISMSLGGNCRGYYSRYCGPEDSVSTAVNNAVQAGVIAVIAAGNSGPASQTVGTPGTAARAITVGASFKKNYEPFIFKCTPGHLNSCGICSSTGEVTCNFWGAGSAQKDEIVPFSSRGPVSWENGILLKPEIIAPGAIICSSRFNTIFPEGEHPYYKPCFDDKHVQIAGTSMAAPVVAGGIALLKQSRPDLSPEEIKTLLLSTTDDLQDLITSKGYGRVNILKAVTSPLLPEANITSINVFGHSITLHGTAKGGSFDHYTLSYKSLESEEDFTFFYTSNTEITNGILYESSVPIFEGTNVIKLEAVNVDGSSSVAMAIIKVNNFEILNLSDYHNHLIDSSNVSGEIYAPDYAKFAVQYKNHQGSWIDLCEETKTISSSELCTIDVSMLDDGLYQFRLGVMYSGNWVFDTPVTGMVNKRIIKDWYIDKPGQPTFQQIVTDIDGDNLPDLIYDNKGYLFVHKSRDNYNQINLKNSRGHIPRLNKPVIFKDADLGLNLITVQLADAHNSYYNDKIINNRGEKIYEWKNINQGSYWNFPLTAFDLDLDGEDEFFFVKRSHTTAFNNSLYGLKKDGTFLRNFPIKIEKEQPFRDSFEGIVKPLIYQGRHYLAYLGGEFGHVYNHGYQGSSIVKYLDIYDLDGQLVTRTVILNELENLLYWYSPNEMVIADLNGDGDTEIIIANSVVEMEGYKEGNLDSVTTYVMIFNAQGTLIRQFEEKGKYIRELAIGEIGQALPSIITVFESPIFQQSLAGYTPEGEKLFSKQLSDNGFYAPHITVGDVIGDKNQEIIVNSRKDGISSIKILDGTGIEKKSFAFMQDKEAVFNYPLITDIDNDQTTDIVLFLGHADEYEEQGRPYYHFSYMVYPLRMDSVYNKSRISWPTLWHDDQHTSMYLPSSSDKVFVLPKSLINNTGSSLLEGYLHMGLLKNESGNWVTYRQVVDDTSPRFLQAREWLALDKIWNPLGVTVDEAGEYRVYANFVDEQGEIIKTETGLLNDSYSFSVSPDECTLTDAAWKNTLANPGEEVTLVVYGVDCEERTVSFRVMEDDVIGDDPASSQPPDAVVIDGKAESSWKAEDAGDVAGDPEFYFEASTGKFKIRSKNELIVTKRDITPPEITVINPADGAIITTPSIDLLLETDEPAVCRYGYIGCSANGCSGGSARLMHETDGLKHTQEMVGLVSDSRYNITFFCADTAKNLRKINISFTTGIEAYCGNNYIDPGEECENGSDCQCTGEDSCIDADGDGRIDDLLDYPEYGICGKDLSVDYFKIETPEKKLFLGADLHEIVPSKITSLEVPNLLKLPDNFSYLNADYEYFQGIEFPSPSGIFTFMQPDAGAIGEYLFYPERNYLYNYTLSFPEPVQYPVDKGYVLSNITHITIYDKQYYITKIRLDNEFNVKEINLMSGSADLWLKLDKTIVVGEDTVTPIGIDMEGRKCGIDVSGSGAWLNIGESKVINKLSIGLLATANLSACHLLIGAADWSLQQGHAVEYNYQEIDGSIVSIASSPGNWYGFSIMLTAADDLAVGAGRSFIDPVFKRFSMFHASVNKDAEEIRLVSSGDRAKLNFTGNDGKAISVPFYYDPKTGVQPGYAADEPILIGPGELGEPVISDAALWFTNQKGNLYLLVFKEFTARNSIIFHDEISNKVVETTPLTLTNGSLESLSLDDDTIVIGYDTTKRILYYNGSMYPAKTSRGAEITIETANITLISPAYQSKVQQGDNSFQLTLDYFDGIIIRAPYVVEGDAFYTVLESDGDEETLVSVKGITFTYDTDNQDYATISYPENDVSGNVYLKRIDAEIIPACTCDTSEQNGCRRVIIKDAPACGSDLSFDSFLETHLPVLGEQVNISVSISNSREGDAEDIIYTLDIFPEPYDIYVSNYPYTLSIGGKEYILRVRSIDNNRYYINITGNDQNNFYEGVLYKYETLEFANDLFLAATYVGSYGATLLIGNATSRSYNKPTLSGMADRRDILTFVPSQKGMHALFIKVNSSSEINDADNFGLIWADIKYPGPDTRIGIWMQEQAVVGRENNITATVINGGNEQATDLNISLYLFENVTTRYVHIGSSVSMMMDQEQYIFTIELNGENITLHQTSPLTKNYTIYPLQVIDLGGSVSLLMYSYYSDRYAWITMGKPIVKLATMPDLDPGQRLAKKISWTPGKEGNVLLAAKVNARQDSERSNNYDANQAYVQQPGSYLYMDLYAPSKMLINTENKIRYTIDNEGNEASQDTNLSFYNLNSLDEGFIRYGEDRSFALDDKIYYYNITLNSDAAIIITFQGADYLAKEAVPVEVGQGIYFVYWNRGSHRIFGTIGNGSMQSISLQEIQPDRSYSGTVPFTPDKFGKHLFIAILNASNQRSSYPVIERRHTYVIDQGPDLSIGLQVWGSSFIVNHTNNVPLFIINRGTVNATNVLIKLFASEGDFEENWAFVSSMELNRLPMGIGKQLSLLWRPKNLSAYNLKAVINSSLKDGDPRDNIDYAKVEVKRNITDLNPRFDLYQSYAIVGESNDIYIEIENEGAITSREGVATLYINGNEFEKFVVPPIRKNYHYRISWTPAKTGDYLLELKLDVEDDVPENNNYSANVMVTELIPVMFTLQNTTGGYIYTDINIFNRYYYINGSKKIMVPNVSFPIYLTDERTNYSQVLLVEDSGIQPDMKIMLGTLTNDNAFNLIVVQKPTFAFVNSSFGIQIRNPESYAIGDPATIGLFLCTSWNLSGKSCKTGWTESQKVNKYYFHDEIIIRSKGKAEAYAIKPSNAGPAFSSEIVDNELIVSMDGQPRITFLDASYLYADYPWHKILSITDNSISLNTSAYPELNTSARITFYDVRISDPFFSVNGKRCDSCRITSEDDGTLTIEIPHFSIYVLHGCGDNHCDEGEDPANCPKDCSNNPEPISSRNTKSRSRKSLCEPSWKCREWNDCDKDGIQIRYCVDLNLCPYVEEIPSMSRRCDKGTGCKDGVINGKESDVDCGGECEPCSKGLRCKEHEDCVSGLCRLGTCESETAEPPKEQITKMISKTSHEESSVPSKEKPVPSTQPDMSLYVVSGAAALIGALLIILFVKLKHPGSRRKDMVFHGVHNPHKNYPKLKEYILSQRAKKVDDTTIMKALIGVGWKEDIIKKAIDNLGKK